MRGKRTILRVPLDARSLRIAPERRDVTGLWAQGIYPRLGRGVEIQRSCLPSQTVRASRVDGQRVVRESGAG